MKFFWKIFFSTMFISISCFSLGGYFLIDTNFEDAMKQEIKVAYELCDILHYSLNSEIVDLEQIQGYTTLYTDNYFQTLKQGWIGKLAKGLEINTINGMIPFRISNEDKEIIFTSLTSDLGNEVLESIKQQEKGYTLKKIDDGMYIQAFRPTTLLDNLYYIEVLRDVTHIFENQQLQYQIFIKIIIIMFIVGGILTASISKILMKPIERLTKLTKEIASGHFNKRIIMTGTDEVATLSEHFNIMSHNLEQKIKELEEEAEKQELFVGAFSHELKTPLTSIIGYSDMLRSKQMDEESVSLCADYIFTEGKRLATLSMRLLDLIVLKRQEVRLKKVSANDFFESLKLSMNPILQEHEINLVQDIEPGIIFIEQEFMKTVCINLIDNARKAIGKQGNIHMIGKVIDTGYILCIQDDGKGMEEQELNKITKAFYRVDPSRSRQEGGVGLGLAICDEILKIHKAQISFKSKVNRGTSVTISLRGEENYE